MPLSIDLRKRVTIHLKKSFNYVEAKQEKRDAFLKEIESLDPKSIVYSDEAGIDDNSVFCWDLMKHL